MILGLFGREGSRTEMAFEGISDDVGDEIELSSEEETLFNELRGEFLRLGIVTGEEDFSGIVFGEAYVSNVLLLDKR
jgi:hypothetical protein